MKSTTMHLTWEPSRLTEVAVRHAAPRTTVRDSLWVSLMSTSRSLDTALGGRLMGFPRRPAAWGARRVGAGAKAKPAALSDWSRAAGSAEDYAFTAIGLSSFVLLAYCFWQMCVSMS
jgi:hypothetical protein